MIRRARLSDVEAIYNLISELAKDNQLLPRSRADIYEHIRDFFVYVDGERVIGCCALHVVWEDLAEIRSLVVSDKHRNKGTGRELIKACLDDARDLGVDRVFALTYVPEFFEKQGFFLIDKHSLPRKIWTDCVNCPYFPDCEEQAVIIDLKEG